MLAKSVKIHLCNVISVICVAVRVFVCCSGRGHIPWCVSAGWIGSDGVFCPILWFAILAQGMFLLLRSLVIIVWFCFAF